MTNKTMKPRIAAAMAHGAFVGVTGDLSRLQEMTQHLSQQRAAQPRYRRMSQLKSH